MRLATRPQFRSEIKLHPPSSPAIGRIVGHFVCEFMSVHEKKTKELSLYSIRNAIVP